MSAVASALMAGFFPTPSDSALPSAAPSARARLLALLAIGVGGMSGGIVGYAVTDLQCADGCSTTAALIGIASAVITATGISIVTVLALRAMSEWHSYQRQQSARERHQLD